MLMRSLALLCASLGAACAFIVAPVPASPATSRVTCARMEMSEYEKYRLERGESSFQEAEAEYKKFKGIDQEFDGGDSGGGVVGDGNTDLEDQHNSATLGALRGGVSDLTGAGNMVGRGQVMTLDDGVKGDTEARTASAGANYFGRSTGLADKLIDDITEDDVRVGRMDKVRAQQKENWFNQRAIHKSNRAQGQGVVFGQTTEGGPTEGGYIAREALEAARSGTVSNEISQADLSKHLSNLAAAPAERLDGEAWNALVVTEADQITETFEVRASPRSTSVTVINVKNDYNTFAPYQCDFVAGSSLDYTVTPNAGTMNRRSGDPVEVVVRYTPEATGSTAEGMLVFETEDMRKVYYFVGST